MTPNLTTPFSLVTKKKKENENQKENLQPPSKNAIFTFSTSQTTSENIDGRGTHHQTQCFLEMKLLHLKSMVPPFLCAMFRQKLTEIGYEF